MVNYNLGDTIKDERYDGKSFLGLSIDYMLYTPNNNWVAPTYSPISLEELVCVHLTDQESSDGILRPHSYAPHDSIEIFSGSQKQWLFPRETLHFTLNDCVAEHCGGYGVSERGYSWKNKRFAYLIPLSDIIHQVISLYTHDTIVLGKFQLPSSSSIIDNQTPEKVRAAIKEKGYRVFDISGVKELDPAFLKGTNININHPLNFSSITDSFKIDGPYTSASINNILMIDGYLSGILTMAVGKSDLLGSHDEVITELRKRIDYFRKRYRENQNLTEPLSRLEKGIAIYIRFLQSLKSFPRGEFTSYDAFLRERCTFNEPLLWKNNLDFQDRP